MSSPPSSPLTPQTPQTPGSPALSSQSSFAYSPSSFAYSPSSFASPASSSPSEPTPKRKRTWEVKSTFGQPSRATLNLWKRLDECEDSAGHRNIQSAAASEVQVEDEFTGGPGLAENFVHSPQSDRSKSASSSHLSDTSSSSDENNSSSEDSNSSESSSAGDTLALETDPIRAPIVDDRSSSDESECLSDSSSEWCEPEEQCYLYEGCLRTVNEAVFDLLSDSFKCHEKQTNLETHLKTFKKYLPKPNKMPKTLHRLFKFVIDQDPSFIENEHKYCGKCLLYLETPDSPCEACQSNIQKSFYTFSVEKQIKHFFENYNLAHELQKAQASKKQTTNIHDITSGTEYVKLGVLGYDLTLMWNTDGISLSHSSNTELWPILFTICELPYHLRSMYIGVCGVWCDSVKPVMNTFFYPFSESMKSLHDKGGVIWKHPNTGVEHKSMVWAPLACGDAPVRSGLQNIQGHNSKHACNSCEQKTILIPLTAVEIEAQNLGKKIRRRRAFVFKEQPSRLRDSNRIKKQGRKARRKRIIIKGVKGPTVVERIPGLDPAKFVFAEYMHGVCLGVVRHFLKLWFSVPGPWNIKDHLEEIDTFVEGVKPTDDICRLLRCVSEFHRYKASECRQWLLFVSLPAVAQFLPFEYVQHWMLLVHAIFILLKDEISLTEVEVSEKMLVMIVRDIRFLYRDIDYVYNVHQLIHLPMYVRQWGPLWATSAFIFEGFNGVLKEMIHGTKNRAKELVNILKRAHGIQILNNKVFKNCDLLPENARPDTLNRQRAAVLKSQEKALLASKGININNCNIYSRIKILRETFTSVLYSSEKKRNNYTCMFESSQGNTSYGEICFFLLPHGCDSNDTLACIKILEVEHTRLFFHRASRIKLSHIIPANSSNEMVLISWKKIISKVIRVGSFVCKPPNKFERNL